MRTPPLDLVYAGRMSRRFTHPVWNAACPDYLRIMPTQPIARMSLPELADWMHKHEVRHNHVAHCIKTHRYPINDDVFGAVLSSESDDPWAVMGLNHEVKLMRDFVSGSSTWKEYGIAREGRSGGWACLIFNGRPVHTDEPSLDRQEWIRINSGDPDHVAWVARDLLWFDIAVNGIIHRTVQFCADFTVETRTVNRRLTVRREVVTLKSKSNRTTLTLERHP